jgi:hypothetical protein
MDEIIFHVSSQGELHCETGPAVIHPDGYQAWYLNGLRHREGGPAIVYPEMDLEVYYHHGVRHA